MSVLGHNKVTISRFHGVYDRGDKDLVPPDHLVDALNMRFRLGAVYTREGVSKSLALTYVNGRVKRFFPFRQKSGASVTPHVILLDDNNKIYVDTIATAADSVLAVFSDFKAVELYNKLFMAFSDGITGQTRLQMFDNSFLNVGGNVATRESGLPPPFNQEGTAANFAAVDGAAGSVVAGVHQLSIAYQSISGYITVPLLNTSQGNPTPLAFTAAGAKKINLSNIPFRVPSVGNGNTVAKRLLLASKAGLMELFFIPSAKGGIINDDSTTVATVDFADTDLISSADYLNNYRQYAPRALGCVFYKGRMVVWNGRLDNVAIGPTDVAGNGSLLIISKLGDVESYDNTTGFAVVNKDDGYYITNCFVLRDILYACKEFGVHALIDNGQEPSFWDPTEIDPSISVPLHGVATWSSVKAGFADSALVADKSGILFFNGTFQRPELTWKIEEIWKRVNKADAPWQTVEIVVDPINKALYCAVPLDGAATPSHVLYGDFTEGLTADKIKWDLWKFQKNPYCIGLVQLVGEPQPLFRFGTNDAVGGAIWGLDTTKADDDGIAIDSFIQSWFTYYRHRQKTFEGYVSFYNALKMRCRGTGNLKISLFDIDSVNPQVDITQALLASPGKSLLKYINFSGEKMSAKLRTNNLGENFNLSRLDVYLVPAWEVMPA